VGAARRTGGGPVSAVDASTWPVGVTFASLTYRAPSDRRRLLTVRHCTVVRAVGDTVTVEYVRPGALTWSSGWLPDTVHTVTVVWRDVVAAVAS
jgi:hypothetical protein